MRQAMREVEMLLEPPRSDAAQFNAEIQADIEAARTVGKVLRLSVPERHVPEDYGLTVCGLEVVELPGHKTYPRDKATCDECLKWTPAVRGEADAD